MAKKFKEFLKSEVTGWKKLEVLWLVVASAVILGLSIYWKDSCISILAAVTGVWCVILTGKGKCSSFIFGIINVIFYVIISWQAKYYGEVMLNALYYFPMNFVGWFTWRKHMNEETCEVVKKKLPMKKGVILYGLTVVAIFVYGLVLKSLGGNLPFVDSMSTVVSITAQILSVWRLTEQWILWMVVNTVTIIMWAINFAQGGENISTVLMWSIYLINSIIMFVHWNREAKKTCATE